MTQEAHLTIHRLNKSYGNTPILRDLSLEIGEGEFVSLLGPSGSGKTTLLRCIAGLEMPDRSSGEMRLRGELLSGGSTFVAPENRNLGMVFQNYAVWPHMNVFENVAFPLRIRARRRLISASQIAPKTDEALALVKLTALKGRFAHELSGGQQQRVALARALAMSPQILLLDEPLSNLDANLREELGSEIRKLQRNLKLTTILVTHDQKEALSLSDRIVVLNHGRIEAEGSPEDLYSNPPSDFVAEFISAAQKIRLSNGETKLFLPRRWKHRVGEDSQSFGGNQVLSFQILSRTYLGSEYEYWGQSPLLAEPIRFYCSDRLEAGSEIPLSYT